MSYRGRKSRLKTYNVDWEGAQWIVKAPGIRKAREKAKKQVLSSVRSTLKDLLHVEEQEE
jgi:hypothetical protein